MAGDVVERAGAGLVFALSFHSDLLVFIYIEF